MLHILTVLYIALQCLFAAFFVTRPLLQERLLVCLHFVVSFITFIWEDWLSNAFCILEPHPGLYSYHPGVMNINQDVDQDVLSEFQRSPFFKGMATNRVNPVRPSGDMNDQFGDIL